MENLAKRVKARRIALGLTQAEVAKESGLKQADISKIETGLIQKTTGLLGLARALRCRPEWLDTGDGLMSAPDANVPAAQIGARRIPLIDYVQAGVWTAVTDAFQPGDAEDWLLTDLDLSGKAFALEIKGDSMRPDFNPGDRVIIDPDVQPQAGDFVVAKNGNEEATFKKYRVRGTDAMGNAVFELIPLNQDFETMRSDERNIHIVGVMVEHRKYRRR